MDAQTIDYDKLDEMLEEHPFPLVFVTIGGDHLYGLVSTDSELQVRGVHAIPLDQVTAEGPDQEDVSLLDISGDISIDIVTQDIATFSHKILEGHGEAFERLYSPLLVCTTSVHGMLKSIGKECISQENARFYLQRASYYWGQFNEESPQGVESLLIMYQSLLSGIQLMKTGRVESNLPELCRIANASYIEELVEASSRSGSIDVEYHEQEYQRLVANLEEATSESTLPKCCEEEVPALDQMLTYSRTHLSMEES